MTSPAKVMLIAFDACAAGIATRLAAEGRAPHLASLLDDAAHAETVNPVGLYVGSLWPTFVTARQPSRHGYHCWEEVAPGGYEHRATTPRSARGEPFWAELSRRQRRVAIVDVPHTWVQGEVNGIQLVEWGCHDRHFGLHSWPPELAAEVESRFGLHPVLGIDAHVARQFAADDEAHRAGRDRSRAELEAFSAGLLDGVDRKAALSLELLDRGDWDLFLTVFGESHAVGHQCWYLHDPDHVRHDAQLAAELGDPIEQVYERLDSALGAHLERAGPDTAVFVLLSHGMGPHYDGTLVLEPLLRRLDAAEGAAPAGRPPVQAMKKAWPRLPRGVRSRLSPAVARLLRRRLRRNPSARPQPSARCGCGIAPLSNAEALSRRFFATPNNDAHGGIRINLAGREPHGTVDPRDVDALCDLLAEDLLDVVNVDTGEPVVDAVLRTSDHYDRAEEDHLPDLLLQWNRHHPVTTVWSAKTGLVSEPYEGWRTGDHRPGGLLLARTPSVAPGSALPPLSIVDLGPTICSLLDVELADVDGRPVPELSPTQPASAASAASRTER